MNLPNLGAHCTVIGCHQLDFLPFRCERCQGTYCLKHHKLDDHSCTFDRTAQNVMPQCPICQAYIYASVNTNRDTIMDEHIQSGCTKHLFETQQSTQKAQLNAHTKCAQPTGCRNVDKLSTIICAKCNEQFCLTHRLPVTHRCAALTEAERNGQKPKKSPSPSPPATSSSSTSSSSSTDAHARGNALLAKIAAKKEAKQLQQQHDQAHAAAFATSSTTSSVSSKNKNYLTLQQLRAGINAAAASTVAAISTALSPSPQPPTSSSSSPSTSPSPLTDSSTPQPITASMRVIAIGNKELSESDRFYLRVDVSSIKKSRQVQLYFFSKKHTIGKILDTICEEVGIENENHLPNGKKLYVCAPRTKSTFPSDISLSLLEGTLLAGDTITLQRQPYQSH